MEQKAKIEKNKKTTSYIDDARAVLDECRRIGKDNGMPYPYFCPGVCPSESIDYGDAWWSLDYALATQGAMFYDENVGKELIENLLAVQKSDGRIPLYSRDSFPAFPFITCPISALCRSFMKACILQLNLTRP